MKDKLNKSVLKLLQLFDGLDRAHGQFIITGVKSTGKIEGRATTVLGRVTEGHWLEHLGGTLGVGVVPIKDDGTCSWGAIDIDVYPIDFKKIYDKIEELKLPLVICRTKSGGAHLFLFGAEPLPAALVRSKLMVYAAALGYPKVEIFPKQVRLASKNDVGNWLNMPYFSHEKTERYCIVNDQPQNLDQFLDLAYSKRVTEEELQAIVINSTGNDDFMDGPPCLQSLAGQGFPQGSRNSGLFAIGVYLRMKFPDDWEKEMDNLNHKFMNPPLPSKEVLLVTRSVSRKNYFYPCDKFPLNEHCSKELCRSRQYGIGEGNEDDPMVNIGALVKLMTNPPVWIIDVDGVRMELDTDDLLSQDRFRKRCVELINNYPNRIKPISWEKMIREKLRNVEMVEAPDDAGAEGRMWFMLDNFCTGMSQARVKEEMLMGKPWTEGGRTYFRGSDFQRYLEQQHFRSMSSKELWAAMRRRGAQHHSYNIKGKCVQCWSVPAFTVQDSDFDVPSVEGEF